MASRSTTAPPSADGAARTRFAPDRCAALLVAIAAHDTVDLAAELPATIVPDFDAALLERCYWLSFQLWQDVEPGLLARLSGSVARGRRLDPAGLRAFKDVRARAKQLRFAYATLDGGHGYPPRLDRVTRLMGTLQDAARGGYRLGATIRAVWLRLLVAGPGARALLREGERFRVTTPTRFRAHLLAEIATIRHSLAQPAIPNRAFHETRKIISRLVAFYDTLTVLAPSDDHHAIDRYLSTINGLMGTMHDGMIVRKAAARRDYHDRPEPLPAEIAIRLKRLAAAFERGCAVQPAGAT